MRTLYQILSLLFFVLVVKNQSISQTDLLIKSHYITIQGDTLVGYFIPELSSNQKLKYKVMPDQKGWEVLTPDEITEVVGEEDFQVVADTFMSRNGLERIFLFRILSGPVELFQGYGGDKKKLFFIRTIDDPEFRQINRASPGRFLKTYFEGTTVEISEKTNYRVHSIRKVLQRIQDEVYPGEALSLFNRSIQKTGLGGGPFLNHFNPQVPRLENSWFKADYHPVGRVGFNVLAYYKLDVRLAFRTGISYVDKSISTDTVSRSVSFDTGVPNNNPFHPIRYLSTSFHYRTPLSFDLKYVEIPVSLQYWILPYEKISPFINFGVLFELPVSAKIISAPETPAFMTSELDQPPPISQGNISGYILQDQSFYYSPYLGLGFQKRINDSSGFELMFRYTNQKNAFITTYSAYKHDFKTTIHQNRFDIALNYVFEINRRSRPKGVQH